MTASTSTEILHRLKSLYPKSIDLTLNRPKRLLADLKHPEQKLPPVIHFAGTNGKGSTLAMVRAGLEAAGQRVHSYISPHLTKFNERITLAGSIIEEDALVDVLLECEGINRKMPISLFEITTAAAFLAFSRTSADYLLLEVGLGGRLDATNVVDQPELTVITPISFDHEQYLGDTLAKIAFEKAGILKQGIPSVISRQEQEVLEVIENVAKSRNIPLLIQDRDWFVRADADQLVYTDAGGDMILPRPGLVGEHQTINAGTSITVLRYLGFRKPEIRQALLKARWPGRMQRLQNGPLIDNANGSEVWLDGGHNPAAGQALTMTLNKLPFKKTRLVCGMLETKDSRGFLRNLRPAADELYGIEIPGEESSLSADSIASVAREVGFETHTSESPLTAVKTISSNCPNSRILVCGSLYLAGQVLKENF